MKNKNNDLARTTKLALFVQTALILSLILLCSCSGQQATSPTVRPPGPIDKYHEQKHPWGGQTTSFGKSRREAKQGSGIQAIGIEHTECYGFCPEFTALYCEDGSAWYCGRAHTEPLGCYEGILPSDQYQIVAAAMDDVGFFEMTDTFAAFVTDNPSVLVLGRRQGKTKVVRDYAEAGPPRLWLLEHLLESMIDRIEWTPVEAAQFRFECPSGIEILE